MKWKSHKKLIEISTALDKNIIFSELESIIDWTLIYEEEKNGPKRKIKQKIN